MHHPRLPREAQDCRAAEAALAVALTGEREGRSEALELLLNKLLLGLCGLSPRATDGVLILREEVAAERYFAVARVFMIVDQSTEPASFDLAFNEARATTSGQVLFGLQGGRLPRRINSRDRLETALVTAPADTIRVIAWENEFQRGANGWIVSDGNNPHQR